MFRGWRRSFFCALDSFHSFTALQVPSSVTINIEDTRDFNCANTETLDGKTQHRRGFVLWLIKTRGFLECFSSAETNKWLIAKPLIFVFFVRLRLRNWCQQAKTNMKSAWAHFAVKLFDKYWQRSRILLSNPWQIERHAMSQRSFTFVERKLRTPHRSRLSCHKLPFHAQLPTSEFPLKLNSVQSHYFLMLQVRLAICRASFVYESCCMWSFSFHTINLHRISWNPFSSNKILTT